jgi:hypothetical protein
MTRYVTVEMGVFDVGKMDKTGAKCVLKGDASVDGVPAKFSLTITCDGRDVFEGMKIDEQNSTIEMLLQEAAQQRLE